MRTTTISYHDVSKQIGYQGQVQYPSKGYLDYLVHRLAVAPQLVDFKAALQLYRFLPEPTSPQEAQVIKKLDHALTISREHLFPNDSIMQTIIDLFNIRNFFKTPSRSYGG